MTDNIKEIALEFARNVGFEGDLFYSHTSGYPQDACIEKRNEDGSKYPINELFAVNSIDDVLGLAQKWCRENITDGLFCINFEVYKDWFVTITSLDEYKYAKDWWAEYGESLPIAIMKAVNKAVREMKND